MSNANLASVYAAALLQLAEESGARVGVLADCASMLSSLRTDGGWLAELCSPALGERGAASALRAAFDGKIEPALLNTLLLLNERGRLGALASILAEVARLDDVHHGRHQVELVSATPIDDAHRVQIEARLRLALGPQTRLHTRVDPSLIGGARLRLGDHQVDGSVARRLGDAKQTILSTNTPAVWAAD